MKHVAAEVIPKLLNVHQNQHQKTLIWNQNQHQIIEQMLAAVTDDPDLLKSVITGDETWMYCYDVGIISS